MIVWLCTDGYSSLMRPYKNVNRSINSLKFFFWNIIMTDYNCWEMDTSMSIRTGHNCLPIVRPFKNSGLRNNGEGIQSYCWPMFVSKAGTGLRTITGSRVASIYCRRYFNASVKQYSFVEIMFYICFPSSCQMGANTWGFRHRNRTRNDKPHYLPPIVTDLVGCVTFSTHSHSRYSLTNSLFSKTILVKKILLHIQYVTFIKHCVINQVTYRVS